MSQSFTRGIPIDTDSTLSANSNGLIPTQKAVKSYIDSGLDTKQDTLTGSEAVLKQGIHYPYALSGDYINIALNSSGKTTRAMVADRLDVAPFYPAQDFNISEFLIYCSTAGAGVNARIVIYDDLNGIPDNKIIESTNLDCSTIGLKSYALTYNFLKGNTYWVGIYTDGVATLHALNVSAMLNLGTFATSLNNINVYRITPVFGSAPATFGSFSKQYSVYAQVLMLIA